MEDLGVDVGKSLMTKALPKDCFMRECFSNLGYTYWLSA